MLHLLPMLSIHFGKSVFGRCLLDRVTMMAMMVMVVFVVGHGESRECDNQAEGQQQE